MYGLESKALLLYSLNFSVMHLTYSIRFAVHSYGKGQGAMGIDDFLFITHARCPMPDAPILNRFMEILIPIQTIDSVPYRK
jgi:hypothetical protein